MDSDSLQVAVTHHRAGRLEQALKLYRQLRQQMPDNADVVHLLGLALHQTGQRDESLSLLGQAVEMDPGSTLYRENYGMVLCSQGRLAQGVEQYSELARLAPGNIAACQNLTKYLRDLRRHKEGLEHGLRGVELAPDNAFIHNNLGNIYNDIGQTGRARAHYRRAVECKPDYGQAWANLASTRRYGQQDEPEIAEMEQALANPGLSPAAAGQMHFALGKARADLGETDSAFDHYLEANASLSQNFPWHKFETYLASQREVYTTDFLNQCLERRLGNGDAAPVFIVGMLRSGTSLTEQILSAHSQLCGVGERPDLAKLTDCVTGYPQSVPALTATEVRALAASYLAAVAPFHEPGLRPADKMMTNFMHLGFIALLFPNAKIVHTRRNPYDVCLSCFFQNFATAPGWASSLDGVGRYYSLYRQLMEYWREAYPLAIHDVVYEDLVESPETVVRELLDFCEVPWEADCLEFYRGNHVVQTASNWQVRQPLDRKRVARWRRYEAHLAPLKKWLPVDS